jgi:hypothetical protein
VKAKKTKFFGFATEIPDIQEFFFQLPMQIIASLLLCDNIFLLKRKEIEANLGSDKALKC